MNNSQESVWDQYWKDNTEIENINWSFVQKIVNETKKYIKLSNKIKILEVGSGTGAFASKFAKEGAAIYLLDTSEHALYLSKKLFQTKALKAEYIKGTMFHLSFKPNSFDIIWSEGVLEHFSQDDQLQALYEMGKILKKKGTIITFHPYYYSVFYRIGYWYLNKINKWPYGKEHPVKSLKDHCQKIDLVVKKEYSILFNHSLCFLGRLGKIIEYLLYPIPEFIKNKILGGYFLVSIIKKNEMNIK